MDPVTLGLIALAVALGTGGTAGSVYWVVSRLRKEMGLENDPIPPVPNPEDEARRQARLEQQRLEEERAEAEREKRRQRDQARREEHARRFNHAVEQALASIPFTHMLVPIGMEKVGERAIGMRPVESRYPADDILTRTIRDLTEIPLLHPMEHLEEDDEAWLLRIATGQALVRVHVRYEPIMDPVYEMKYEKRVRALYVLLDLSGSMSEDANAWRIPLWREIVVRAIDRARAGGTPTFLRAFNSVPQPLQRVLTDKEATTCKRWIRSVNGAYGTDIAAALLAAIDDFKNIEHEGADIAIVTDGEHQGNFPGVDIRTALEKAGIRLHATMLGVANDELRACADTYLIVESDYSVHPLVRRTP